MFTRFTKVCICALVSRVIPGDDVFCCLLLTEGCVGSSQQFIFIIIIVVVYLYIFFMLNVCDRVRERERKRVLPSPSIALFLPRAREQPGIIILLN